MLVGLAVTLMYIFASKYGGFTIAGIIDIGAGVFGAATAILTNIIVSLATKATSIETQKEVLNLRYPEQMTYKDGEVWMDI
jgi:cation/acetate symporter